MSYWLFGWLDEQGVRTTDDARKVLAAARGVDSLREAAVKGEDEVERDTLPDSSRALVASRGLDLTGDLDCSHEECRRKQVDRLFRRVWHYFDVIVVDDPFTHAMAVHWADYSDEQRADWLFRHLDIVLYLREVGADSLVEFRSKLPRRPGWRGAARVMGLKGLPGTADTLARDIAKNAEVRYRRTAGGVSFEVEHAIFAHTQYGNLSKQLSKGADEAVRTAIGREVVGRYAAGLVSDLTASSSLGAPLGAGLHVYGRLLPGLSGPPHSASEVAFEMQLPVLDGLPLKELIAMRGHNRDLFEVFQAALRKAMTDALKEQPGRLTAEVARSVRDDVLLPELARIRVTLKQAESTLAKKAVMGLGLTTLATLCGLLVPTIVAVPLIVGSASPTVWSMMSDLLRTQGEVATRDMYFLWKASEEAG